MVCPRRESSRGFRRGWGATVRLTGGGELSFVEFCKRLYREYEHDAVADTAAQLSYYLLFSLFPFLFFVAALTAYLPLGGPMEQLLSRVRPMVPREAMELIDTHLRSLVSQARPRLLTFALIGSIWSASRGVDAVRRALNLAYDVTESRAWWKTQLASLGMTVAGAFLVLAAVALLIAGGQVGFWLAGKLDVQTYYVWTMRWLRWPLTATMIMTVAALAYYYLPDVKQSFKFITPGSVVGTLLWLLTTWGFGQYVSRFGEYNVTYGSLGGVVVLLTWLYLSGFIFLIGGEVNAILEHAAVTGKAAGARAEGETPAPRDERPSAMPPGAAKDAEVAAETAQGPEPKAAPA
jgi:membrane protein